MISQMKSKAVEDDDKSRVSKSKSIFRPVLLFVILMSMLVNLVSACGQGNQPKTAKEWLDLGEKYLLDLEYEQAVVAFKKVIEIEPNNIPSRIGMAKAYVGLDKPNEAKAVLFEVLELDPENEEATDMLPSLSTEEEPKTTWPRKTEINPTESNEVETNPANPEGESMNLFINGLLAAENNDGKWGYIDNTGTFVIEPQFEIAGSFSTNGLAVVAVYEEDDNYKWGYIDKTGAFVIEPRFDGAESFSNDGLAVVFIYEGDDNYKSGYIDETGALVIEPQPDIHLIAIGSFSANGLAAVANDDGWGFIDKTGALVIEPQFETVLLYRWMHYFSANGLAVFGVHEGDHNYKLGFIDETGAFAIEPQFDYVFPFSANGLAAVGFFDYDRSGMEWGFIDKTGYFVVKPQFVNALPFSPNGLAAVAVNKGGDDYKSGYIDETGAFAIEPQFDGARCFSPNGLAAVAVNKGGYNYKWGFIDETGTLVIEPQFDEVRSILSDDGYLVVVQNNRWGVIDREGNEVIPCQFKRFAVQDTLVPHSYEVPLYYVDYDD